MKYIDAEKLIAEIERYIKHYESSNRDDFKNGELYICQELLSFVDSLQQKPAEWSEEDEKIITAITKALKGSNSAEKIMLFDGVTIEMVLDWLKSLCPQPKQEWSEEDKGILLSVKCVIDEVWHSKNNMTDYSADELEEMWHWLDTLWQRVEYPQPQWKPSEEQMQALMDTLEFMSDTFKPGCTLATLFNDLKKLI